MITVAYTSLQSDHTHPLFVCATRLANRSSDEPPKTPAIPLLSYTRTPRIPDIWISILASRRPKGKVHETSFLVQVLSVSTQKRLGKARDGKAYDVSDTFSFFLIQAHRQNLRLRKVQLRSPFRIHIYIYIYKTIERRRTVDAHAAFDFCSHPILSSKKRRELVFSCVCGCCFWDLETRRRETERNRVMYIGWWASVFIHSFARVV